MVLGGPGRGTEGVVSAGICRTRALGEGQLSSAARLQVDPGSGHCQSSQCVRKRHVFHASCPRALVDTQGLPLLGATFKVKRRKATEAQHRRAGAPLWTPAQRAGRVLATAVSVSLVKGGRSRILPAGPQPTARPGGRPSHGVRFPGTVWACAHLCTL